MQPSSGGFAKIAKRAEAKKLRHSAGTRRLLALALTAANLQTTSSLAFHPKDPADNLWDTWLYRKPEGGWLLNYLVKHHTPRWEAWNAISSASSTDGSHWSDLGVSIQRHCDCCNSTCASDGNAQLGSSSVWKLLGQEADTWLMAYGSTPAAPPGTRVKEGEAGRCEGHTWTYYATPSQSNRRDPAR